MDKFNRVRKLISENKTVTFKIKEDENETMGVKKGFMYMIYPGENKDCFGEERMRKLVEPTEKNARYFEIIHDLYFNLKGKMMVALSYEELENYFYTFEEIEEVIEGLEAIQKILVPYEI